jgi:hypothetical protein
MMLIYILLFALLQVCLSKSLRSSSFDLQQANISLWLATATYCGKDNYQSRTFIGPTTGFVVTDVISPFLSDIEGFVGYLPSDSSIYVAFRGTSDIRNWIVDFRTLKTDYASYPECNCQVHKGFYLAEQKLIGPVIDAVKKVQALFPSYAVKVTGHSLGAAIAQLAAMDLLKAGYGVSLYTFGEPRVGTKEFSAFTNSKLETWRLVHDTDEVPHIPFQSMNYYHVCTEVFEDKNGQLRTCDSSCEDPTCADQYKYPFETNGEDHMKYLGLPISCDSVSQ